jgi:hypothetical protein
MKTNLGKLLMAIGVSAVLGNSLIQAQPSPAVQDVPPLDFTMIPTGGWPLCDIVPSIPCPTPGREPWLFSVDTKAGPEVVAFQVILTFLPKDGKDGDPLETVTFVFARNDQRYGTNADGTPLMCTAHVEPLGRIQPQSLTVKALTVSFGKKVVTAT